jgi:hypothetical protein
MASLDRPINIFETSSRHFSYIEQRLWHIICDVYRWMCSGRDELSHDGDTMRPGIQGDRLVCSTVCASTYRMAGVHTDVAAERTGFLPCASLWHAPIATGGVPVNQYEDLLVDALLDRGFTVEEAIRLIELQERVERERREEDDRKKFAEWMGRISGASE